MTSFSRLLPIRKHLFIILSPHQIILPRDDETVCKIFLGTLDTGFSFGQAEAYNLKCQAGPFHCHRMTEGGDHYKDLVSKARWRLRNNEMPLSQAGVVMAMQGWNKVLAFKTAFSEALLIRWRLLIAQSLAADERYAGRHLMGILEAHEDPLASCLGVRIRDTEELLMRLLDSGFRSLCPGLQTVQREAYRPMEDDKVIEQVKGEIGSLECNTTRDVMKLFARRGVLPDYWVRFVDAFLWCMKTHVPYAREDDEEELEKADNSYAKAVTQTVAVPCIEAYAGLQDFLRTDLFVIGVKRFWNRVPDHERAGFGEVFYESLLEKNPDLMDYFSRSDLDSLAVHLMATINFLVESMDKIGSSQNSFRSAVDYLGEYHRRNQVPTYTYALIGGHLLDSLAPLFKAEEDLTKCQEFPVSAALLHKAWATLYTEVASLMHYPMLLQERMINEARKFYETIGKELGWSCSKLTRRMLDVEQEIKATESYTQTSEELQTGARLAWRNSAKCIGRISWQALQVRDLRHVSTPEEIFKEVEEHLRLATAGTNIQSIMSVFALKKPKDVWGTRFWSSQYVRYACYKDEDGKTMGDPANLELTEYLVKNKRWEPPNPRTPFDVLPLVLKVPGISQPFVHQLPDEVVFELPIEHPTKREITALGYKWTTVPAISNFKMNLGGIVYQNIPFNGWFVSTEIVRNLMERYDAGPAAALALGIDMAANPFWRQSAFLELEVAVVHSFQKNGYTIVDPYTVGSSFCTHVRREREQFGRECPGQWSWIGGLVGPTNPAWHLEMRDFLVLPQYQYCAEALLLHNEVEGASGQTDEASNSSLCSSSSSSEALIARSKHPRVLIAYGSETGNAEGVARKIKRAFSLLKPTLLSLDNVAGLEVLNSHQFTHFICVCSTFGKGNPPSNATKFFASDFTTELTESKVQFAVLALGSTIYPDFCKAGITLDSKLAAGGLERLVPVAKADEAAGAEVTIADFTNLVKRLILPSSVEDELKAMASTCKSENPVHIFRWLDQSCWSENTSKEDGWLCVTNEELLPDDHSGSRSIRKIAFRLPDCCTYESGDHVAVSPMNSDAVTKRFVRLFELELLGPSIPQTKNLQPDNVLDLISTNPFELDSIQNHESKKADPAFKTPTTLVDVIRNQVDLTLSSKNVSDILHLLKRFLDDLLTRLDRSLGEYEAVVNTELVQEFCEIISDILESDPDSSAHATDSLVSQFPTVVALFEKFKPLFFEDFTCKTLGWSRKEALVKLPEGTHSSAAK